MRKLCNLQTSFRPAELDHPEGRPDLQTLFRPTGLEPGLRSRMEKVRLRLPKFQKVPTPTPTPQVSKRPTPTPEKNIYSTPDSDSTSDYFRVGWDKPLGPFTQFIPG